MRSLLLVEDDPRLGPLVAELLSDDWQVTLAADVASARNAVATTVFDVLVVDRRLPDGDGLDIVRDIRARRNATPVLMLTALGELHDRVGGLDAGADDYLVKPFESEELSARLRALVRDHASEGEPVGIGGWTYYPDTATVYSPYEGRVLLTDRENSLLRLLATAPTTTFTREQILGRVFEHGEQPGTVDTYVHYLRRKTDRDLIATVRGTGYRIGTP